MAKAVTKSLTLAEKVKKIKAQLKAIHEQAGIDPEVDDPIAFFASDPEAKKINEVQFVPTPCMELNERISGKPGIGGFPIVAMTIVTGVADVGKTSLILESIALSQKRDPNFMALWIESEHSLNDDILNMFHIDQKRFVQVIMSPQEGGEAVLDRAEGLLNLGTFDMFVINSLKALTPKSIINKPISEDTMAVHARMNSKFCAKFLPLFSTKRIAAVIVAHLSTQIGGFMVGDPLRLSGGEQIKYLSILQLDLRKLSIGEGDPIGKEEGMKICAYIRKNHINASEFPYAKITYYIIYGQGTETRLALMQRGLDRGILTKAGAYIKFVDKETGEVMSWQGKQAFRNALSDPDLYAKIEKACGGLEEELTAEEIETFEKEAAEEQQSAKKTRKKKEEPPDEAG